MRILASLLLIHSVVLNDAVPYIRLVKPEEGLVINSTGSSAVDVNALVDVRPDGEFAAVSAGCNHGAFFKY